MEPDFEGWATKVGLECSDGRTIMPGAFEHQDQAVVPLVYQHDHNDPTNVLGHVLLTNKPEGVWAQAFFNKSEKAQAAREAVMHKDITMMSIWANKLIERGKKVMHGLIREVSLVLAGGNPGAQIVNLQLKHSADDVEELDEAYILTGEEILVHSADGSSNTDDKTSSEDKVEHQDGADEVDLDDETTVKEVIESMTPQQQTVMAHAVGAAAQAAQQSDDKGVEHDATDQKGNEVGTETDLKHNVFDKSEEGKGTGSILSHDDMRAIIQDAAKEGGTGSLKASVNAYALAHGIDDIDLLFPDAVAIDAVPEWVKRRTEWVSEFLGAARKSPFSRIKTLSADLTHEEARAKGYVKGTMKKEQFFGILKRVTTPTTVYKKQKLDRDDMVDITDFDVVAWLKGEMRVMLDEEIARAALIGDGRDVAHDDKINEQNIRPIAKDNELYTTTVNVNLSGTKDAIAIVDAVTESRRFYKGTGLPNFYTTETVIAAFLTARDTLDRRLYKSLDEVATELRVAKVVSVEVMEDEPDIIGILVNPVDYVFGATRGGEVTMFDDFDIDFNQYKYLIETRLCGALIKVKSAMVLVRVPDDSEEAVPEEPAFNEDTGVVTIPAVTGVVYKNADTDATIAAGAMAALDPGETINIVAEPDDGYNFPTSEGDAWSFTRPAA